MRHASAASQGGGVDRFVQDLMSLPPLAAAEELALARRARTGDSEARSALITAGLRSVALRACMLGLRGEELRDAVQSGAVGLIRAVDRFDPDRGARLATYAWRWIGAEMRTSGRREEPLGDEEPAVEHAFGDGADLLEGLDPEAAEVLRLRFGIGSDGAAPLSRTAVSQRLGLRVTQVRTIEGKAMRQLRGRLAKVVDRAPHQ